MRSSASPHLEAARHRLRSRFQSKFPHALKQESHQLGQPTAAVTILSDRLATSNHLEEARLRLHQHFVDKFPVEAASAANKTIASETTVYSDSGLEHLQVARQRIRERFQEKFPDFTEFPNTVDSLSNVMHDTKFGQSNAVVVTSAVSPYEILHVNKTWEALCGFTEDEVLGKTFHSLGIQGSFTEPGPVQVLSKKLAQNDRAAVHLTNATKDGALFRNYLRVAPLYDGEDITHFIGVLQTQKKLTN